MADLTAADILHSWICLCVYLRTGIAFADSLQPINQSLLPHAARCFPMSCWQSRHESSLREGEDVAVADLLMPASILCCHLRFGPFSCPVGRAAANAAREKEASDHGGRIGGRRMSAVGGTMPVVGSERRGDATAPP